MSIAAQLATNEASLHDANVRLMNMCSHASAEDILEDPEYRKPQLLESTKSEFSGMSIYQLNAKLQETESAISLLNELWLTKSLIQEIRMSLNPIDDDHYLCDKDELFGVLQNLKKLKTRTSSLASEDLAISPVLQACCHDLTREFAGNLIALLLQYISTNNASSFVIKDQIEVNESPFSFADYMDLVENYESFASSHDVTDELRKYKLLWDESILDRLVRRKSYFSLDNEGFTYTLSLVEAAPGRKFLSRSYFQSLRNFVAFVNVVRNQSFKNYYSTKISNSLVEVVSENIKTFMDNKQQLTEELMETLDFISKSSWNIPIRCTFSSPDRIQADLLKLYNGFVTDKYINEVREVFNGASFHTNLNLLKDAAEDTRQEAPVEESDDWNDSWGSDDDEGNEASAPKDEDNDWDEDWDDGWDDDEGEDTKPKKPAKLAKSASAKTQSVSPSAKISIKYSQLPFKFSIILAKFAKESSNADPQDIMDTIGALSMLSYPSLMDLFLLLNDLQRVKAPSDYLCKLAEEEWNHIKQQVFDEITTIITGLDFTNRDATPDLNDSQASMNKGSTQLEELVARQFENDLQQTNTELFKMFILELLDFINNLVLEIIINSDEITEFQSEKFTSFLESMQHWESIYLARLGEQPTNLSTYNKSKQAVMLINRHLKEIMEVFYQGELYDFTTDELIKVIKNVFVPSDLRENCIGEIIEIRNS